MAVAAGAALSCLIVPTICSRSSALSKNSLRSVAASAFSSASSLVSGSSHASASERGPSNLSCARSELPSRWAPL
jgi:hypothetical protein